MRISHIVVTRNRRESLLRMLDILEHNTPLPRNDWETLVVDNASTDGTARAVAERFPRVRLIRNRRNEGLPARNRAIYRAQGEYCVLLDDDSYPVADAVPRAVERMDGDARLGALVGRVVLPGGGEEAPALPSVLIGCATVLRTDLVRRLGGFPQDFFRQAEEYDLSFRIWDAGYRVMRLEDVVFRHEKAPGNRASALVHRLDMRNNLVVAHRYLPEPLATIYRRDWTQRYMALARHAGHGWSAWRGIAEAALRRLGRAGRPARPVRPEAVEHILQLQGQARLIGDWARQHRIRNVAIADFSKNLYATYRGCLEAGLQITCIADNHPAYRSIVYRGIPVLPDPQLQRGPAEGIVVSTVNPARIEQRVRDLEAQFSMPVLRLWQPAYLGAAIRRKVA